MSTELWEETAAYTCLHILLWKQTREWDHGAISSYRFREKKLKQNGKFEADDLVISTNVYLPATHFVFHNANRPLIPQLNNHSGPSSLPHTYKINVSAVSQ